MKILVVNNNAMFEKNNGLYVYKNTGEFITNLCNQDNRVECFQFKVSANEDNIIADYNLLNRGIKITSIKRSNAKLFSYVNAYYKGIISLLKNDFLYLFYPTSFFILGFIAKLIGKKYGLYVRGEIGFLSKRSIYLYKNASVVLTVSPKFTELISKYTSNVDTIKPMLDFTEEDIVLDRKYNTKQIYYILFIGRIEIEKGVFELINAIKHLKESGNNNFVLDIVGDGPCSLELQNLVKQYNLTQNIIFHGLIMDKNRLAQFYLNADILILPTYNEGFPRVLYEAMIFGTPIITSIVGGIGSLMKDMYNCYEIKVQDADDIYAKLKMFVTNYIEVAYVAVNGTKTIQDYLKKHNVAHAEQLINMIKK